MTVVRDTHHEAAEAPDAKDGWPDDNVALARLLTDRSSCRAFRPDPVPRETTERMLQLAQRSATWCNTQPWQVIVTEGEATERFRRALLARATKSVPPSVADQEPDLSFPTAYSGVYQERRREVAWQLYESVGVAYGDRAASARQTLRNFELFDAPHALIITSPTELGVYGAIDCGLYLQALLLAAESLRLGMVAQAALASYGPSVREFFGLSDNRLVVAGCSFGYSDEQHPANSFRSRRAPLGAAVRWEAS